MKKSIDVLIWALLLFLITPSSMALASWNSTPGDPTYAWKLSLEKVFLKVLSPSGKLQSTTQIKIAERRFDEVEQVLNSEHAAEGLDNLNKQLVATSTNIKKIDKAQSRSEVTDQYLVSLKKMSVSLDEKKSLVKTGQIATTTQKDSATSTRTIVHNTYNIYNNYNNAPNNNSSNTQPSNPNTVPTSTPTANQQQPTIVPTGDVAVEESNQEVIDAIEETQQNIEDEIEIIEQVQIQAQQEENPGEKGGKSGDAEPQIQENSGINGNNGENNDRGSDKNNDEENDNQENQENKVNQDNQENQVINKED